LAPRYCFSLRSGFTTSLPVISTRKGSLSSLFSVGYWERLEAGRAPAVLVTGEEGARVGVAADAVSDVMTVPPGAFRPAPRGGGYLVGVARVGEQLVNLIDLAEILRDQATLSHGEKP